MCNSKISQQTAQHLKLAPKFLSEMFHLVMMLTGRISMQELQEYSLDLIL